MFDLKIIKSCIPDYFVFLFVTLERESSNESTYRYILISTSFIDKTILQFVLTKFKTKYKKVSLKRDL